MRAVNEIAPAGRPTAGVAARLVGASTMSLAGGCALMSVSPPSVEVASVELRATDILDQSLEIVLCAFNPNDRELDFERISFVATVAGEPFAEGVNDVAVRLPSHRFVPVSFAVATTLRHLDVQLPSVAELGELPYRLQGDLRLSASLGLTIPFDRSGELGATTLGATTLGATTLGATTLGATTLGATTLGATTLGATTLGQVLRSDSATPQGGGCDHAA